MIHETIQWLKFLMALEYTYPIVFICPPIVSLKHWVNETCMLLAVFPSRVLMAYIPMLTLDQRYQRERERERASFRVAVLYTLHRLLSLSRCIHGWPSLLTLIAFVPTFAFVLVASPASKPTIVVRRMKNQCRRRIERGFCVSSRSALRYRI